MISINQQQSQQQRLLPQQIQYQKLLQLPLALLEQEILEELELNPMLEEAPADAQDIDDPLPTAEGTSTEDSVMDTSDSTADESEARREDDVEWQEVLAEQEYDDEGYKSQLFNSSDWIAEDFPQRAADRTLAEELLEQVREQPLSEISLALAEEIIGNIDDYGYFTRSLAELIDELNSTIDLEWIRRHDRAMLGVVDSAAHAIDEPYGRERIIARMPTTLEEGAVDYTPPKFTLHDGESMLQRIQQLEPPGVGARDLRECLMIQLRRLNLKSTVAQLAHRVLAERYDDFAAKRFERIALNLECSTDELRTAIVLIRSLNPKPGEGAPQFLGSNHVIPDFTVERSGDDLVITFNDQNIPLLRISPDYKQMLKDKKNGGLNQEARTFLRSKMDAAKIFIAAIKQRRHTLRNVMRGIVELQRDFFLHGVDHLRPMVYRDLADLIGLDLSTISRVVNGKYVQTDYGVFELRYYFSEHIATESGEQVSNKLVKQRIRDIIDAEDKANPVSDDALTKLLNDEGYLLARRTVAKYREQMEFPVARLRRTL